MVGALEAPGSVEELYLARGDEVAAARPLMTGDVVGPLEIPGLESTSGDVIILTHPCSMRKDGVNLVDRLLVARVRESDAVPFDRWSDGFYTRMPLPHLYGDSAHAAAYFDEMGFVHSNDVENGTRRACLGRKGINLLQQRFIWYLARFAIPTFQLDRVASSVFEEADLCEEWVTASVARGQDRREAHLQFHDWIRAADASGEMRQKQLADPQALPAIRRELREEIARRGDAEP